MLCTIIPVILSSDKTLFGDSGRASAWPLYMTIGNIVGYERFSKESHSVKLIALFPAIEGTIQTIIILTFLKV